MGIFQIEPQSRSYSTSQGDDNMGQDISPTKHRGCEPGHTMYGLEEVESLGKHRQRQTESHREKRGSAMGVLWSYDVKEDIMGIIFGKTPGYFLKTLFILRKQSISRKSCKISIELPTTYSLPRFTNCWYLPRLLYHPFSPYPTLPALIWFLSLNL